jgi:hypothetical protein
LIVSISKEKISGEKKNNGREFLKPHMSSRFLEMGFYK